MVVDNWICIFVSVKWVKMYFTQFDANTIGHQSNVKSPYSNSCNKRGEFFKLIRTLYPAGVSLLSLQCSLEENWGLVREGMWLRLRFMPSKTLETGKSFLVKKNVLGVKTQEFQTLLWSLPARDVWGIRVCVYVCVCLWGLCVLRRVPAMGRIWSQTAKELQNKSNLFFIWKHTDRT